MPSVRHRVAAPASALVLVLGAFIVLSGRADEGARLAAATCRAAGCYCEAMAERGVRQPIDAWSSIAPAFAGATILFLAFGPRQRGGGPLSESRVPAVLLAGAACSIAVFSFFYHATLTWIGEWLDGVSLFLLAGYGIAWASARASRAPVRMFAVTYAALAIVPGAASWWIPALRKPLFLGIALLAIVVELAWRRVHRAVTTKGWFVAAIACFFVATVAWTLDARRLVCSPESKLQLHALWHLLSAPIIVSIYVHFASEHRVALGQRTRQPTS